MMMLVPRVVVLVLRFAEGLQGGDAGLHRVVEGEAEADGGMEVVGLARSAEVAHEADRRQRPGVAADGELVIDRIALSRISFEVRPGPFRRAAREVVRAPRRFVLVILP